MRDRLRALPMLLASPTGILVAMPLVVLGLFVGLSYSGCTALRRTSDEDNAARFHAQVTMLASEVSREVGQVDPLLDRLGRVADEHGPDEPIEPVANELMDLLRSRPGLTYASISFPDGTFQGAYLDGEAELRFQDSRLTRDRTLVRRFAENGRRGLRPVKEERTDYDPRKRGFYAQAAAAKGRVFTPPYAFYLSNQTGVTAALARRRADGSLHAVTTVDLDVHALTRSLRQMPLPEGAKIVVLDRDDTVLSFPGAEAEIRAKALGEGQVVHVRDLADPLLNEAAAFRRESRPTKVLAPTGAEPHLAVTARVPATGIDWTVVLLVPTRVYLGARQAYERRSAVLGGVALLAALSLSGLLAWNFVRVRRELQRAHEDAQRARREARELGSYRLKKRIGQGGMGEVWAAEHKLLARRAAVKLIRLDGDRDPDEVSLRFRREAEALAELSSPHTIHLYDYGVAPDGALFLVTELLSGVDLESLVAESGPLPPARACSLLVQALRSLEEAHEHGLIHRDVKPANLFLARAGSEVDVLKVLDFGLVRAAFGEDALGDRPTLAELREDRAALAARITAAGKIFGTPEYMAPEQGIGPELGLGDGIDARTDLYAVGCVAVWLLSGETPYAAESGVGHLLLHATEPMKPLCERVAAPMPNAFVDVLERCMRKRKEERPASAREVLDVLLEVEFPAAQRWTEQMSRAWWGMRQGLEDAASEPASELLRHDWAASSAQARVDVRAGSPPRPRSDA